MTKLAGVFLQLILASALIAQGGEGRFEVLPAPGTEHRAPEIARALSRSLERLGPLFPNAPSHPFTVHLHGDLASLPERIRENLHPETPGLALLGENQIHLILDEVRTRPPNDLQTVVDHEVVHILLHQDTGAAGPHVPRWFHEGLAQHLSGKTYLGASEEELVFAVHTDRLLRFPSLRAGFPEGKHDRRRAYAQSFSFVSFLARRLPVATLLEAARASTEDEAYGAGFFAVTRIPLSVYEDDWVDYLRDDSGASYRQVMRNCFSYLMILGVVLLALAGIRRWNRDLRHREKLEREEREAEAQASRPPGDEDIGSRTDPGGKNTWR